MKIKERKNRKIVLFIYFFLNTLLFSLFIYYFTLNNFSKKEILINLIINNNSPIYISKSNKKLNFSSSDLEELNTFINKEYSELIKITEDKKYYDINLVGYNSHLTKTAYYKQSDEPIRPIFLKYTSDEINELKIIGNQPTSHNEVIINKILADFIIERGISIYNADNKTTENKKFFSYNELIESKSKIPFGHSYIIISGILDENISKYDILKKTEYSKIKNNKELKKLYNDYLSESYLINILITNENFFDNFHFFNKLKSDYYSYNENDNFYKELTINYYKLHENELIYSDKDFVNNKIITDNEVIIDIYMVDILTNGKLTQEYYEWSKEKNTSFNSKSEFQNFIKDFIDKNNIINKGINLKFDKSSDEELIISGVILDNFKLNHVSEVESDVFLTFGSVYETEVLISNELMNKYEKDKYNIVSLKIKNNEESKIKNIIDKLDKMNNYKYHTNCDKEINRLENQNISLKIIILYCLIINFIICIIINYKIFITKQKKN